MVEVGMSGKTKTVTEDRSWYRSYCKLYPYYINDEILNMLHCVRPIGEECLADGLLVAGVIMTDIHTAKKSYETACQCCNLKKTA